jgi:PKD repeat protein
VVDPIRVRLLAACVSALALAAVPGGADEPCDQWQLVNPLPIDRDLLGATHGNDRYVVLGRGGAILVSSDALSWRQAETPSDVDLHAVVWTGTLFVAVGANGTVLTSSDGGTWAQQAAPSNEDLTAVAAGGPQLVAVGAAGAVLTSPGGVSWTLQPPPGPEDLRDVAWIGSEYLAVGGGPDVLASPDGAAWTVREVGHQGPFSAVAWSGSTAVVTAQDRRTLASTDGLRWVRGNAGLELTDVVWSGDRFVGACRLGRYAPLHSFDGINWHYGRYAAPGLELGALAWSGTEVIGAGVGGAIAVSRDHGEHFKPVNTFTGLDLYGVAANPAGAVMAAGTDSAWEGAILASDDLLNWEVVYRMGLEALYDVAASDELFVAVGVINEIFAGGAMILRSLDGRNWGGAVGSVSGPGDWPWEWYSAAWDGDRFVVVGDQGAMAISEDGSSWYLLGGDLGGGLHGVASDGVTIVAVGSSGLIVTSDGQDLSVADSGQSMDLHDVAYGGGAFVAVGDDGIVLTSLEGEIWAERSSGTDADLHGIRFIGDRFLAVGTGGVVLESPDGDTWSLAGSAGTGELLAVLEGADDLVVVGRDGVVLRNACSATSEPPEARFVWRPTLPEDGTPVRFTDLSTGDPDRWSWDFGDGFGAEGRAVTHTFAEPGAWPVTLTAGNVHGDSDRTTLVTVRPFCGAPPPTEVTAPASVASGEEYEVSWEPTLQDHEFGEYSFLEDTELSFADLDGFGTWRYTSVTRSHSWIEGASFYVRVIAINYCPDSSYRSPPSATVRVDIEPDVRQLGDHVSVIPAAAHGPGLEGTDWRTDVVIHNPGAHPAPAYLFLLERNAAGQPVGSDRHWIEPGQSLLLADAVGDLQDPGYGALLVATDRPLMVGSRTFTSEHAGTFGQFIDGVPVAGGMVGSGDERRLIQLTQDTDYRTNLGLANPRPLPVEVEVELHRADGELLATRSYQLPGLSSLMDVEVLSDAGGTDVADGYAVVSSPTPEGSYVAFASVVDNRSGDPVALTALQDRSRQRVVTRSDLSLIRDEGWDDLIAAGEVYVAVGPDSLIWSRDGVTWQRGYRFEDWWDSASRLAWNGHQVLAVGESWAYTSPDGIAWTRSPLPGDGFWSATWDGARWVALGRALDNQTAVGFSFDGETWDRHVVDNLRLHTIVWAGDRYAAVGASGLATSLDGLEWELVDGLDVWLQDVEWNGSQLLVTGAHQVYFSRNWIDFENRAFDRDLGGAVWAGHQWVVSASARADEQAGVFLTSSDGDTWYSVARTGARYETRNIAWDGSTVMLIDFSRSLSWLISDREAVTVPAAAHVSGFGGSQWRSDLELHNPRRQPVTCTVGLLERDSANQQPRVIDIEVGPESSERVADVLAAGFGFEGAAALRVQPDSGAVMVSSRTYDDAPAGSYGQLVPGMRRSEAIWPFETGRLTQLRHSPRLDQGYRTNIGLVSLCDDPMEAAVHLFLGSGEHLGAQTVSLPPVGVTQLNNVFRAVTDLEVVDGFAILSSATPRCAFHAYASVVDNGTNDPALIPVEPWTPILYGGGAAQ